MKSGSVLTSNALCALTDSANARRREKTRQRTQTGWKAHLAPMWRAQNTNRRNDTMTEVKPIPRMRTAAGIMDIIRAADPETEVTEYHIRRVIKSGAVHVAKSGRKQLADADAVIRLLATGQ